MPIMYRNRNHLDKFIEISTKLLVNLPTEPLEVSTLKRWLRKNIDTGTHGVVSTLTVIEKYPPSYKFWKKLNTESKKYKHRANFRYFMYCPALERDVRIGKQVYDHLDIPVNAERCERI